PTRRDCRRGQHPSPTRRSSDLGIEYQTHGLTGANARKLDEQLQSFAKLYDASGMVDGLRLLKSPAEIAYAKRAAELSDEALDAADRKSTRLNSSHVKISYAVFC